MKQKPSAVVSLQGPPENHDQNKQGTIVRFSCLLSLCTILMQSGKQPWRLRSNRSPPKKTAQVSSTTSVLASILFGRKPSEERLVAAWLQRYLFLLMIYHDIVRFHIPVHDSLAVAVIQSLLDKKAQRKISKPSTNSQCKHILICDSLT